MSSSWFFCSSSFWIRKMRKVSLFRNENFIAYFFFLSSSLAWLFYEPLLFSLLSDKVKINKLNLTQITTNHEISSSFSLFFIFQFFWLSYVHVYIHNMTKLDFSPRRRRRQNVEKNKFIEFSHEKETFSFSSSSFSSPFYYYFWDVSWESEKQ